MLIDAAHPEETRVAIVENGQVDDFDFETTGSEQLRGNIYLAKITRVEPSLQAAFVEYGGNRHGFLAFSEIHPDYYQLPAEDREALLREAAAEAAAAIEDEDDDDEPLPSARDRAELDDDDEHDEAVNTGSADDDDDAESDDEPGSTGTDLDGHAEDEDDSDVESDTARPARPAGNRRRGRGASAENRSERQTSARSAITRRYKIQEVIRRRQVLLVQVVKEERGNKGAALTTFLSLAGRYSVLMPNTPRGGGISRKIVNSGDRKRLKSIVSELDVPEGQGLIVRTAGAKRTSTDIKRDYDYLSKLWETIVEKTLSSDAPALINAEGGLVHRAMRDMFDKGIEEVLVQGDGAFEEARGLAQILMPAQAKKVQHWNDEDPLYVAEAIEAQLDSIYSPTVQLKSGGYLVINQTEALVAIDVNSGKSTRERNIEQTALRTNLEAAEEACRQMRLRDLAGLIVIDFIDMEESRNNRAVEKRLKECLKADRARVQHGRVSQFGLMEISRQRRRQGVLQATSAPCQTCNGTGRCRSIPSAALQLMRALEARIAMGGLQSVAVRAPTEVALYILNNKRDALISIERRMGFAISIRSSEDMLPGDFLIDAERDPNLKPKKKSPPRSLMKSAKPRISDDDEEEDEDIHEASDEDDDDDLVVAADGDDDDEDSDDADGERKPAAAREGAGDGTRKKRRRRRGGRNRNRDGRERESGLEVIDTAQGDMPAAEIGAADLASEDDDDEDAETPENGASELNDDGKRRRRGRRGGRRRRRTGEDGAGEPLSVVPGDGGAYLDGLSVSASELLDAPEAEIVAAPEPEARPRRRSRTRADAAPASVEASVETAVDAKADGEIMVEPSAEAAPASLAAEGPKRTGWWNRMRGN
jgi:ribonuclease E